MKLFGYLLVACAGLGLFACSTEDEVPTIDTGKTKSVTLVLNGISTKTDTKAIDAPTTGTPPHQITLKDVRIIFYNIGTGTIYRMVDVDPTTTPTDWTTITSGSGLTYHNLNQLVDAVMIIGNKTGKNFDWTGNANEIKDSKLWAANENTTPSGGTTKDYVTLFGTTEAGGTDNYFQASTSPVIDPDDDHPLYVAKLQVKPLVARFEIGNIRCTNLGAELYSYITLKTIGLIEFSQQEQVWPRSASTISQRLITTGTTPNITMPGVTATPINQIEGPFEFGKAGNGIAWAYNDIPKDGTTFVKLDDPLDNYNPSGTTTTPDGGDRFTYNFFPEDFSGGLFPNIKLVMDEVHPKDDLVTVPWRYVTTIKFSETLTPKAGNIYQVSLNFEEKNIGPWDPSAIICVNVTATVIPWTIVALTPLYE